MKETVVKNIQRILAGTLVFAMMLSMLNTSPLITYGYEEKTGMIYSASKGTVITRVDTTDSSDKANELIYGKPITILDEVTASDGVIWCKIKYGLRSGGENTAYVRKSNVLFDSDVTVIKTSTINADDTELRDDAGEKDTNVLAKLAKGHEVELIDSLEVTVLSQEGLWYRVRTTVDGETKIGWVSCTKITGEEGGNDSGEEGGEGGSEEEPDDEPEVVIPVSNAMIFSGTKTNVIVRNAANPAATQVCVYIYGKSINVIKEVTGTDGLAWCEIKVNDASAYVPKANVLYDTQVKVFASGQVNANNVAFRNDAGTTDTMIIKNLNVGHKVELLDTMAVDSKTWYRVRATIDNEVKIGWILANYITVDEASYETDEEYKEYLRKIGFPESYIEKIAILHAQFPNWSFEPYFTGLNWADVIAGETAIPNRNLVIMTDDDAKKTTDSRGYDWKTNTWVFYDTDKWVGAHPDYIAYCMDPRNFITLKNVWMFETLSYSTLHTSAGVASIIKGTFMENSNVLDYVTTFMEVAKESGVSAYHLATRVRFEQGVNGTSKLISGDYPGFEGYYNYFNVATAGNGDSYIIAGLTHAKNAGWNTRRKAILGGAQYLGQNYIAHGQDTLYFQKFDVVQDPKYGLYWHQFQQSVVGAISESASLSKNVDTSIAHVFKIPVYNNMPAQAVQFNVVGNRNNYLKSLDVSGIALTPTFAGDKTEYAIIVGESVNSVTVTASAIASTSTVSGTGAYELSLGTNIIKVNCKSQSGDVKTYTITIVRQEGSEENYLLESTDYVINDKVTGITPGTTAATFLSKIKCTGGEVKLLTKDGAPNTGNVGTGNKLAVYVGGSLVATKDIIVYGDVNGDGKVNVLDARTVNKYTISLVNLTENFLLAADANHDGKVNVLDARTINKFTIGLVEIKQK